MVCRAILKARGVLRRCMRLRKVCHPEWWFRRNVTYRLGGPETIDPASKDKCPAPCAESSRDRRILVCGFRDPYYRFGARTVLVWSAYVRRYGARSQRTPLLAIACLVCYLQGTSVTAVLPNFVPCLDDIQWPLASANVLLFVTCVRSRSAMMSCSLGVSAALSMRPSGPMIAELPVIELPMIGLPDVFMASMPASVKAEVQCRTKAWDSTA